MILLSHPALLCWTRKRAEGGRSLIVSSSSIADYPPPSPGARVSRAGGIIVFGDGALTESDV